MKLMDIRVQVLVFASLRERLGFAARELTLPEGSTVSAALEALVPRELQKGLAAAVNRVYAGPTTELQDGDELALLPPVSGGSGPFSLRPEPLDLAALIQSVAHPTCGAIATFQGTARELEGDKLELLEYEAYPEMAEKAFAAIAAEAKRRFGVERVAIAHRMGRVPLGEASVAIAVASPHRAEALDALRFVIDTLKQTAPIWKKEVTRAGSRWVEGHVARPLPEP